MKKIAIVILIVLSLLLTGCNKEDYDKYMNYLNAAGGSITCEYEIDGDYVYLSDVKKLALSATSQGINITYTLSSGVSYTGKIITFKFNGKGEISGLTEENKNSFGGYTIYIKDTFNYKNFLDQYTQHDACPNILRILPGNKDAGKRETEGRLYDYDYGQYYNNYTIVSSGTEIIEKPNPCGTAPSYCINSYALTCKQYQLTTKLDGDVTVELGRVFAADGVSLDKYYYVISDFGRAMDYNYGTNKDSRGGTLGSYSYMIRAVDWDNLFLGDCNYADSSSVIIDEKDMAGAVVAHITTRTSQTISDYDMFSEPDEGKKRTITDITFPKVGPVEVPEVNIQELYFCEQARVLKAFSIAGMLLFILKILVPLIIIVLGTIDFAKAVISTGDKANKEAIMMLVKRFIIGVIIFLLPTILDLLLGLIGDAKPLVDGNGVSRNGFTACTHCLFNPFDSYKCSKNINANVGGRGVIGNGGSTGRGGSSGSGSGATR